VAVIELLTSDWQRFLNQLRMCPYFGKHLFCKTRTDYAKGCQESQQPTRSQIITICIEIPHSAAFAGIISKKLLSFYIFKTYWRCSSFLHSQERKRRCSCSLHQYTFRSFHMGWGNSHQYLVGNQECNTLDDRINFNPLTCAPIIRNTVLHNATLP